MAILIFKNNALLLKIRTPALIGLALLMCTLLLVVELGSEAVSLPPQYLGSCGLDSGSILLNGVDAGEGLGMLIRGKTTLLQSSNFYGKDVYVALGDRSQAVVLAHPKDPTSGKISATITVPPNYRNNAASLHIYSMLMSGECSDRWSEVYIK